MLLEPSTEKLSITDDAAGSCRKQGAASRGAKHFTAAEIAKVRGTARNTGAATLRNRALNGIRLQRS